MDHEGGSPHKEVALGRASKIFGLEYFLFSSEKEGGRKEGRQEEKEEGERKEGGGREGLKRGAKRKSVRRGRKEGEGRIREGRRGKEFFFFLILDFGKTERPLISLFFNPKWNLLCPGATPATSKAASQDKIHVPCLTGL